MKKYVLKAMPTAALILCAVSLLVSCASTAGARKTTPEMIDYKDKKFGKKVPDWVTMEAEFWTQDRYFNEDGDVSEESFTYYALYTIPKSVMDKIIKTQIKNALEGVSPKSQEEKDAMERAVNIFENGLVIE